MDHVVALFAIAYAQSSLTFKNVANITFQKLMCADLENA